MPPIVLTSLSLLQLALQAAPEVKKVWDNARLLFGMWFSAGLITAEQQDKLKAWADAHEAASLAGEVPPEFTIEPDPV